MSDKIIHFDLQSGAGESLDIAREFPMTDPHPLRHASVRYFVDDMREQRHTHDLSVSKEVRLTRFRTMTTLDLAVPDVFDIKPWQQKVLDARPRPRTIDLVPPLDMPYGALDVRSSEKGSFLYAIQNQPKKTYADLFTRRLPYGLMVKRSVKETNGWIMRHRRGILATFATILMTTVPIGFFVKYAVQDGYDQLASLRSAANIAEVRTLLQTARDDFERANFLFFPFSWIPGETVDLAGRAIRGGRLLTRGLSDIVATISTTSSGTTLKKTEAIMPEYRPSSLDVFPLTQYGIDTPTDWIETNKTSLKNAIGDIALAGDVYIGVATGSSLGQKMHDVGTLLSRGSKYLQFAMDHENQLIEFLGHNEPIRYLILNQNRDELRANGGFPGSVILFTLYKGNILDLRRDDVYYYDWNLYPYKEPPPPGLALLTDNYGLRDVNYYPDFHETLEKANSFIERSGDSTITSGIAIHQGMIENILEKIGPVSISGVTTPFDSANFSLLMSTLVENQYAREHHPKDILFRFATALLDRIKTEHAYDAVFDTIEQAWQDGDILFASRDDAMDRFIADFRKKLPWECTGMNVDAGVSSEASQTSNLSSSKDQCSLNWVYPVFTSVSGNKSDRYITRTYSGSSSKLRACTYENIITLSLTHTYKKSDTETLRSYMDTFGIVDSKERAKLEFIEGNSKNRAFTRVYVPKSTTLAFTGTDITVTENDTAKVYSFMMETPVGATTSKTLRYTVDIPECLINTTKLQWTRQPGIHSLEVR